MIEKLTLSDFGKFKDRAFDLASFTVFRGDNESGKTTLFDALFDRVCGGERRGAVWTRLKDRYGAARACEVKYTDGSGPYDIPAEEFIGLYGVRAGAIHIEADSSRSWIELAKTSLFSGGVDPARVAKELARRNDYSGNVAHNKEIKNLGAELAQAEAGLQALEAARAKILSSGAELERLANERAALEKKLAEKSAEAEKKYARVKTLEAALAAAGAQAELELTEKYLAAQEKLARLAPYSAEKLAEYGGLKEKTEKLAGEIGAAKGEQKALAEQVAALAAELGLKEAQIEKAQKQFAIAALLLSRIALLTAGKSAGPNQPLRYLTWGAGLAAAGLLFYALRETPQAALAAAAVVLVFAGAAGYFMSAASAGPGAGERALLGSLTDEWHNAGLDVALVRRDTLGGMQEALIQVKAGFTNLTRDIESLSKRRRELDEKIKDNEASAKELVVKRNVAEAAARDWLNKAGCADRDEYYSRIHEAQACRKEAADLQAGLAAALASRQAPDVPALKIKLRLAIEEQCGKSGGAKADRKAFDAARAELDACLKAKEKLAAEKAAAEAALEGLKGQAAGGLSGLPESIRAERERIDGLKIKIESNKLEGEASAIASEIFAEMAEGSNLALAALAGEIETALKGVLPAAAVEISSLALGGVKIKDAGGTLRPAADISSGTRDCFMLAARLAIARKARGNRPGLLVLDEPFYTIDGPREQAAVSMLKEFQAQTGWQVLLLTKDAALAATAAAAYGDGQGFKLVEL